MLIYNTTFVCEDCRVNEFLTWLNADAIPRLMKSDMAHSPQLSRIVSLEEQPDKTTNLSLQFRFNGFETLEKWLGEHLFPLLSLMNKRFGDSVLFFSTVLEPLPLSVQN